MSAILFMLLLFAGLGMVVIWRALTQQPDDGGEDSGDSG